MSECVGVGVPVSVCVGVPVGVGVGVGGCGGKFKGCKVCNRLKDHRGCIRFSGL